MNTPWKNNIPPEWDTIPLKYLMEIRTGGTPSRSNGSFWEGEIPWVSSKDMQTAEIGDTEEHITQGAIEQSSAELVPEGSLLMVSRSGILDHTIPVAVTTDEVAINQDIRAYIPREDNVVSEYIRNVIFGFEQHLLKIWKQQGATVQSLNSEAVSETEFPIPPKESQKSICSHLRQKVERIDESISKYNRLNRLIDEKEMSLITHYVTKGIWEKPMKDSDIPWLSKIPSDWDVVPLKYVADVRTGIAKGRNRGSEKTRSVPYLRVANVQDGYLDLSEVKELELTEDEIRRYSLKEGDVLMNEGGDYDKLGRGTVWHGEIEPCVHQNHVFCVRPHDSANSEWISLLTQSKYLKHYFMMNSKQTTNLASISASNIASVPLVWPPEEERNEIIDDITDKSSLIEDLKSDIEQNIELLKEKKRTLTMKTVTGQTDINDGQESEALSTLNE